jgi:alpha/beta hydrolase family protein/uncharacterized protein DUF6298
LNDLIPGRGYEGWLGEMAQQYAHGVPLTDPRVSPVYGDFTHFPPTILTSGSRDLLLSDTVRVNKKLRQAGVETSLQVFEGQPHAVYLDPDFPESQFVFQEIADFLNQYLGKQNTDSAPQPLQLSALNPHYFEFRGKPTVLLGSSEHYGAVMNRDFNFVRYLDNLKAAGLNATRVFSGTYRERPGKFGILPNFNGGSTDFEIAQNSLAPDANAYLSPWLRSREPGALDGGNKFDLNQWNDEYFKRLKDFVREAGTRGIVVEYSFFSPYYVDAVGDHFWELSPFNVRNNINNIGDVPGGEALSLKNTKLLAVQEAHFTSHPSRLSF